MTTCTVSPEAFVEATTATNFDADARVDNKRRFADPLAPEYEPSAAPRSVVSLHSYYSRQHLKDQWSELDAALAEEANVVLVLHAHFGGSLQPLLARRAASGGRLAIVAPPEYSLTRRRSTIDEVAQAIDGWDDVSVHETVASGVESLLAADRPATACRLFYPEWESREEIYREIGRRLTTVVPR